MKNKVLLTEEDFRTLVNGGVVEQGGIQVALQDIGFDRMFMQLDAAVTKFYSK